MSQYAIIEVDAGLTVVEFPPDGLPEEEALRRGGLVIDPGPFESYDQACDAMFSYEDEAEL